MPAFVRIFFRRRHIPWPTLLGWLALLFFSAAPITLWALAGERVLSSTHRIAAPVLIVEGWIGLEGLDAARHEYNSGGYRWIVAAGGPTGTRWGNPEWNYAEMARSELIRAGIDGDDILLAAARGQPRQRTWEAATAVATTIAALTPSARPTACNVFTLGVHAARSRLIYSRALGPNCRVGVVAWIPRDYKFGAWWQSTERAKDFLTETAGFAAELLFNIGRKTKPLGEGEST